MMKQAAIQAQANKKGGESLIKLFSTTDSLFSSNGDKIILPLKAKVHKEDNGSFYLDLETNLDYIDNLTANRIIVANMIKIGSITIDDVPDALKEEVEDLLSAKSDSDKTQ